ncbi:hypothetical protein CC86DRAFT_431534 [Ophiobolus disseminans]|uniref:Uncharacterized protein n=1 Tax=Ophiobolus disseminans TaxID=1469910 RepID=A0A6A7AEJ8_9PLEO|nr:hypothetical protein CC86DRAFT_431534 [Ophiobolus disseminans]
MFMNEEVGKSSRICAGVVNMKPTEKDKLIRVSLLLDTQMTSLKLHIRCPDSKKEVIFQIFVNCLRPGADDKPAGICMKSYTNPMDDKNGEAFSRNVAREHHNLVTMAKARNLFRSRLKLYSADDADKKALRCRPIISGLQG